MPSPGFDLRRYRQRTIIERYFSKLKHLRAVATRYDKREFMGQATVDVASIRIWLQDPRPMIYGTRPSGGTPGASYY